ncbi:MAG TPA: SDR family NAD(P)-dependent oxidoreductase, partial [Kiloniellales bacterium]|nr:SDR family NAD(P)-dependent oxidoreductase [Kiloniellales bacterium]
MVGRHPDDYPRAALVTGAARRIGRAIALDLAARGFAVGVHYNANEAAAAGLVREIEAGGGRAAALRADLAKETETARLIEAAAQRLGPLGLLVNNASVFRYDDIATVTRETWDAHLEPNLRAPLVLTQHFAELLPKDLGGLVVNLLDARVLHPS